MEEQKLEETVQVKIKKKSRLDKIISKALIPLMIIGGGYLVNTVVCSSMIDYNLNQKIKTSAYQELVQNEQEITDLSKMNTTYSVYLSGEGKKSIEQRIPVLTEKNKQLSKELSHYTEKSRKWYMRAVNPLEYLK